MEKSGWTIQDLGSDRMWGVKLLGFACEYLSGGRWHFLRWNTEEEIYRTKKKKKNVLKLNGKYTCIHTYVKYNFVWQKKLQEDYM